MVKNKDKLAEIAQAIIDNRVCADLADQATQMVFGTGSPNADIVFIGEAPGKKEDETGQPFVGAAGKFLDQMLDSIGLKRGDIYITNIVKYRPPDNRDPKPEEKEEFLPYLEAQLEAIQPALVCTLGRHSMNCFLPSLRISETHGKPKRYKGRVFLPLYHPAAALYNGGMRQQLLDDFALIPQIIKKINSQNKGEK
ncbi:MAG: uracil-DNA glycosylase [bacterium]|nr:uracil-DNA glycosylase [bacterium]